MPACARCTTAISAPTCTAAGKRPASSIVSSQASLPGFGPPVATDRLFLALFPDPVTAGQLAALAAAQVARHGLRGAPLATDRFHVTLFHLGDTAGLRTDVVAAASAAAARVDAAAFSLAFDRVTSFDAGRERSPFVLTADGGNASLHAFRAALGERLREAGLGRHVTPGFTPHVTLAYDKHVVPTEPVPPLGWRAAQFVLVHSLLGKTRHVRLAQWTLPDA